MPTPCTYPACKCIVQTSTSQPEPVCPKGLQRRPVIELKKIKTLAGMSDETHCYSAQLWVDGVHLCDVGNEGHGGGDRYMPRKGSDAPGSYSVLHEAIAILEARIKATHDPVPVGMLGDREATVDPCLEIICADLVNAHLVARDVQRLLKRTVAYVIPGETGVRYLKGRLPEQIKARAIAAFGEKRPEVRILNTMPMAEAVALFRANSRGGRP